uniref:Uncharacterized protein n=1 Tax=viral metagenome TaxID=1070528 RepID=A0A6C0JZL5_9ZZZZ
MIGLINPPEMFLVSNTTNANAAPMANGLPVAKTTYTKNMDPKNSTKYLFSSIDTLYKYIV